MSKSPAFAATYADFRLVKGRKVLQVVLEMPIEQAEAFVSSFGIPNPASETWVGMARLAAKPQKALGTAEIKGDTPPAEKPAEQPKKRWGDLPPVQQAGIACGSEAFRKFLNVDDADAAAVQVREICGVVSRSELKPGSKAAHKWADLYGRFENWQRYGE